MFSCDALAGVHDVHRESVAADADTYGDASSPEWCRSALSSRLPSTWASR